MVDWANAVPSVGCLKLAALLVPEKLWVWTGVSARVSVTVSKPKDLCAPADNSFSSITNPSHRATCRHTSRFQCVFRLSTTQ